MSDRESIVERIESLERQVKGLMENEPIRTRQIEVLDDKGNARIVIGPIAEDRMGLVLKDELGRDSLTLEVSKTYGSGLRLLDDSERQRAYFLHSAGPERGGFPSLGLLGHESPDRTCSSSLGIVNDSPSLSLFYGTRQINLNLNDTEASVEVWGDGEGQVSLGSVDVESAKGKTETTPLMTIRIEDEDERVVWDAP